MVNKSPLGVRRLQAFDIERAIRELDRKPRPVILEHDAILDQAVRIALREWQQMNRAAVATAQRKLLEDVFRQQFKERMKTRFSAGYMAYAANMDLTVIGVVQHFLDLVDHEIATEPWAKGDVHACLQRMDEWDVRASLPHRPGRKMYQGSDGRFRFEETVKDGETIAVIGGGTMVAIVILDKEYTCPLYYEWARGRARQADGTDSMSHNDMRRGLPNNPKVIELGRRLEGISSARLQALPKPKNEGRR